MRETEQRVLCIFVVEPSFLLLHLLIYSCAFHPLQHGQLEQSHFNLAHLRNLNALQRLLHTSRTRHLSELPKPQVCLHIFFFIVFVVISSLF